MVFPVFAGNSVNFFSADAGLDVCTPNLVTVALFSSANRGGDLVTRNDNVLSKSSLVFRCKEWLRRLTFHHIPFAPHPHFFLRLE